MSQIPKFQNFNMTVSAQMGAIGGQLAGLRKRSTPGGLLFAQTAGSTTYRPRLRTQPRNSDRGSRAQNGMKPQFFTKELNR